MSASQTPKHVERRDPEELGRLFDETYYARSCGETPYVRTEPQWAEFFGKVADQLIRALRPRIVLDAGCALGFLVEAFWDRGVEAKGIDVSPFAIANVRRDMAPHCSVGSIATGILGRYDLITCIEVLEHMPADQAHEAIRHMTSATDTILFSSTPFDLDEPTHFNVNPLILWLREFQAFGFSPDLEFDASFVAQHAMLLRRREQPFPVEVLNSFASLLRLRHHAIQLSNHGVSLQNGLSQQTARAQELEQQTAALQDQLEHQSARAQELERDLDVTRQQLTSTLQTAKALEHDLTAAREDSNREKERIRFLEQQHAEDNREIERALSETSESLLLIAEGHKTIAAEIHAATESLSRVNVTSRVEVLEEVVEGVCRPVAELFPAERLEELEKMLHDLRSRPDALALKARMDALDSKMSVVDGRASAALNISTMMVNSRIWRTLVKSGGALLRVTGLGK